MIYDFPDLTDPIRQGDIFIGLPRIDMSLQEVLLADEKGERVAKWEDLAKQHEPLSIIVPVRPVAAIAWTGQIVHGFRACRPPIGAKRR